MINYDAQTPEEFFSFLIKELKLRQQFELETVRKTFELNNDLKIDRHKEEIDIDIKHDEEYLELLKKIKELREELGLKIELETLI